MKYELKKKKIYYNLSKNKIISNKIIKDFYNDNCYYNFYPCG